MAVKEARPIKGVPEDSPRNRDTPPAAI